MPTFLVFKDGEKVADLMGAVPPKLLSLIKTYNPEGAATKEKEAE